MRTNKNLTVRLFVAIAALAAPLDVSLGQQCDTVFTGLENNNWENDNNWTLIAPDQTLVGCIPPGKTAVISVEPADALAAVIDGTVIVEPAVGLTPLTLYSDSTINGTLELGEIGELKIANDLTITGNGGEIVGTSTLFGVPVGYICDDECFDSTGSTTLTVAGVDNSNRSTSLLVHGHINIKGKLINNAYVVADAGLLVLTEQTKSSVSGYWVAEEPAGTLQVNNGVDVTGSGTWKMTGPTFLVSIRINNSLTNLSGTVELLGGTFFVEEPCTFATTGNLTWGSASGAASIRLSGLRSTARFGN